MGELLFMKPVFKEAVWGGKKLREDFGYEIPGDSTGECWGIGAHKMETARLQREPIKGNIYRNCGQIIRSFLEMKMENMEKNFHF